MGIKEKRKISKDLSEPSLSGENESSSGLSEPPSKKIKVLTGADFIQALKGPGAPEALKQWLYLISNQREQAQMDKDASPHESQIHDGNKEEDQEKTSEEADVTENVAKEELDVDISASNENDLGNSVKHIDLFLKAGGSLSDLVYTLPTPENAQVSHLRHVFRALAKVLLRISADHHHKIPEAIEVCRDLITSYSRHINDMLKIQRALRERVLNLELLTAMVSLDPKFAKEVLNLISLEADTVDQLTSLRSSIHVRVAFLKFIVALLIDGDNSLIMSVVNKPWLVSSLMEGLQYDPSDIVAVFLMTLKKKILENKSVPKSAKQIIFNTDVIIFLLHLYKWKGPQNRPQSLTFWAMKKMNDKPKLMAEIDCSEVEQVSSAVHELLLVLLTDHRYGIIFRDTSIAHQSDRHNKMVSRVLQRVGHPWENSKVAELVSKILAACPDSLRTIMSSIEPFIQPRSSPQWFHCISFLKKVLEDQCPEEILLRQLSWLTMMQLGAAALEMCIPLSIVRSLSSNEGEALCTSDVSVVKCTVDLLIIMLKKIFSFVEVVRRWAASATLSYAQFMSFRRYVTENLLKNLPKLSCIQKAWVHWSKIYLNAETSDSEQSGSSLERPLEVLFLLLELMEMYQKLCPAILDPLRSAQSDLKSSMTDFVLNAAGSVETSHLRNRLYQFLLDINDQSFSVENSEIREPIVLMVNDLVSPCTTVKSLAWSVLQSLIQKNGFLEGSPQEAVVWLSTIQESFSGREKLPNEVASIVVDSMICACTSYTTYFNILARCEEGAAKLFSEESSSILSTSDCNIFQELFEDASENTDVHHASSLGLQVNVAALSPWVPSFLEVWKDLIFQKKIKRRSRQIVEEFACKIILRLFHRLPHPGPLLHLCLEYVDILPAEFLDYLKAWLPGGCPKPVESNLVGENSLEIKISDFLFGDKEDISTKDQIHKIFLSFALPMTEDDLEAVTFAKKSEAVVHVVQMLYFISFHVTQLAQLGKLTEDIFQKSQEMVLLISEIASNLDKINSKERGIKLFFECFKVILCHPLLLQNFSPLARHVPESSRIVTRFMITVAKAASKCEALHSLLAPYKEKLLSALKLMVKKKRNPKGDPVGMVDAFPLEFQEVADLLSCVSNLPVATLILNGDSNVKLSHWGYLSAHLLSRVADFRSKGSSKVEDVMLLSSTTVSTLSNWILDLLCHESLDLNCFVEAFLSYISSCPQQTSHIPDKLLASLVSLTHSSPSDRKLAEWIASRAKLKNVLHALKSALKDKTKITARLPVILPVLFVSINKSGDNVAGLEKSIMMPVYENIMPELQDYMTCKSDHPEWLSVNADVVALLIKYLMKDEVREGICKNLEKKAPALKEEKLYYLKLVTEILQKHPSQLLLLLLAWLAVFLKKYGNSSNQSSGVQLLCQNIIKVMKVNAGQDFKVVRESKVWQETLRLALKFGLGIADQTRGDYDEYADGIDSVDTSCRLLQTLALLFDEMYSSEEESDLISMVYNMTVQHSAFLNIMMSHSISKLELVELLHVLVKLNRKVMDSSHVPLLLAAYNASLSKTDRALLRLIILYERSGVELSGCRPYFWGRQGASHYSIWSQSAKNGCTLFQQPRPDQVLGLLEATMVLQTISEFPVHSSLSVEDENFEPADGVYDPSFYLPLFIYLLSPESPVLTHMFVRSGALALTLLPLSSFDISLRAAAYTTLSRFVSHLQMARGRNKDLLLHFMTAVQKGISSFGNGNPRLPNVVTVFLAKTAIELTNPQSPLYRPLMNFVLVKPAMNLRTLPEFMPLLHSDNVEHISHRNWILKVLSEGLRTPIDVQLSMEVVAFKLLPTFYSSCLPDSKSRINILQCLRSAVGVPYGACCLTRDYCLTSWLHQAILNLNAEDITLVAMMVRLLFTLWQSLSSPTDKKQDAETGLSVPQIENPAGKVLRLSLALVPKLTPRLGAEILHQYVSTLCGLTPFLTGKEISVFTKSSIMSVIGVSSLFCPNIREFYDLLELGCNYIDDETISHGSCVWKEEDKLRQKLRTLIIEWVCGTKKE